MLRVLVASERVIRVDLIEKLTFKRRLGCEKNKELQV